MDVDPPQGYETIGHIAHFNLKPEHEKYKHLVGEVLLDKNKNLRTVVNKTEKLHNVYRTPTLDLMAGKKLYETSISEGGCLFHLNFESVYWCTGLNSERGRVIASIKEQRKGTRPVILDLFCGIGPFAIRCARQLDALVVANDLNPECYKYLKRNVLVNKVGKTVVGLNMDAREVVKLFYLGKEALEAKG